MLRIRSVEVRDFGPYRGAQTLTFGDRDGVIVVYGENMRGKTTLLNAIRFALFGKVLGRGERALESNSLLNIAAARDGVSCFSVTVALEKDGSQYEVTRKCTVP